MMKSRVKPKILELLANTPMTKVQLAERSYCHPATAGISINQLLVERKIFVGAWKRAHNQPVPVYYLGKGRNKARPVPLSTYEKNSKRYAQPEVLWGKAMKARAMRIIARVTRLTAKSKE